MKHICMVCSEQDKIVEFDTKADWMAHNIEHKKKGDKSLPPKIVEDPPPKPEKPKKAPKPPPPDPLVLVYSFNGQCTVCRSVVDTLHVDVEAGMIAVAYCPQCKKQLKQQQVIPIEEQFKKKKK